MYRKMFNKLMLLLTGTALWSTSILACDFNITSVPYVITQGDSEYCVVAENGDYVDFDPDDAELIDWDINMGPDKTIYPAVDMFAKPRAAIYVNDVTNVTIRFLSHLRNVRNGEYHEGEVDVGILALDPNGIYSNHLNIIADSKTRYIRGFTHGIYAERIGAFSIENMKFSTNYRSTITLEEFTTFDMRNTAARSLWVFEQHPYGILEAFRLRTNFNNPLINIDGSSASNFRNISFPDSQINFTYGFRIDLGGIAGVVSMDNSWVYHTVSSNTNARQNSAFTIFCNACDINLTNNKFHNSYLTYFWPAINIINRFGHSEVHNNSTRYYQNAIKILNFGTEQTGVYSNNYMKVRKSQINDSTLVVDVDENIIDGGGNRIHVVN